MYFSKVLVAAAVASFSQVLAAPHKPEPTLPDIDSSLAPADALLELQAAADDIIAGHKKCKRGPKQCSLSNARIRRNWYVSAVPPKHMCRRPW